MSNDEFRKYAYDAVTQFAPERPTGEEWAAFA